MVEKQTYKPDTTCAEYDEMSKDWPLVRDLMGETRAMQDAGQTWLPKWPKESESRYQIRLKATTLFNGFQRSVNVLAGKVFKKGVVVAEDTDADVVALTKNIDREGGYLKSFCYEWFKDGIQVGLSHVFVDTPAEAALTQAEAKAKGIRPFWVHIKAEDLIYWESDVIDGARELNQIRFKTSVNEPDGPWGKKAVTEIRQYQLVVDAAGKRSVSYARYRRGDDREWFLYLEGETKHQRIPLVTFYARKTGFMTAKPPLMDLAWVNLTHWQSSSEQRHCLALGRRPFPAFFGFSDEDVGQIEIGPFSGPRSTKADARVEIIEPTGAAIESGRQDLQDLKEEMAVLALELLVRKEAGKTATESANEQSETDSDLGGIVQNMETAINNALQITSQLMSKNHTGGAKLPFDSTAETFSQQELAILVQLFQTGAIPWNVLMQTMMDRGILRDDLDLEEVKAQLAAEVPI